MCLYVCICYSHQPVDSKPYLELYVVAYPVPGRMDRSIYTASRKAKNIPKKQPNAIRTTKKNMIVREQRDAGNISVIKKRCGAHRQARNMKRDTGLVWRQMRAFTIPP